MRKRALGRTEIHWASNVGDAEDPASQLLRGLPVVDPAGAACEGRPVVVEVTRAREEVDRVPAPAGYRASFFHGHMRALEREGAFLLVAPGCRVTVGADGDRIDALVDPARLVVTAFADTTLFVALCIALRRRGLFHMHAGGVVRGDGTRVLIIGDSGAGKSTLTLSLLDARATHVGDDALFVTRQDGKPRLLAFPRPFHLGPRTLAAFPSLGASEALVARGQKRVVPLASLPAQASACMAPPHLVLFPRVTGEPATRTVALSPADAFGRALRSSALLVVDGMGDAAEQLALLRELFADARAFDVHLGADWLSDPHAAAARLLATP